MQGRAKTNALMIQQYVLDCISAEGYPEEKSEPMTDAQKIFFLIKTFNSEYNNKWNRGRYKTHQLMFINWCMGLPSSFNMAFENYKILELMKEWNGDQKYAKVVRQETLEEQWLELYWGKLYMAVHALARKHDIAFGVEVNEVAPYGIGKLRL